MSGPRQSDSALSRSTGHRGDMSRLSKARSGRTTSRGGLRFRAGRDPSRGTDLSPPADAALLVLLVEGLMVFHEEAVRDACELRVFVDCDEDTRFMRRLTRDTDTADGGRGRSVASVFKQWADVVKPAHHKFVEPTKRHAHIVVPSRGLKVPTHLQRRGSAADAATSPTRRKQEKVDYALAQNQGLAEAWPALRLLESFVRASTAAAFTRQFNATIPGSKMPLPSRSESSL